MYETKFKLVEPPFKITPDPRFLHLTTQHRDAIEKCLFTVEERGGLVAIYGSVGMGKTTIVRRLLEVLKDTPATETAMLINPAVAARTENAFLRLILEEFDIKPGRSFAASQALFQDFMAESHEAGKNLVLIIDEADKLTPRLFSVLHALLNFESNTQKFLQIILIGQDELAYNIDKYPAIKSRVARFGQLKSLTQDDTNEMIAFRWHTASGGKSSHPFNPKALDAIYVASDGLPREINKLCHESLLIAADIDSDEVTAEMVVEAAKELRLKVAKND